MSELRGFLDQMSSETPGPSAGSAAGVTAAMGAALAAKTARLSHQSVADAAAVSDAAVKLRTRALALAEADAEVVRATLSSVGDAVADPSAVPVEIGEVAEAVAEIADQLAGRGNPRLHADAVAAGHLAAAARAMVQAIVESNTGNPD